MNIAELKIALDKEGVQPIYYSLNGIRGDQEDNTDILEKKENRWMYYHYERRGKFNLQYFNTEDEACKFFLKLLTEYPQSRIYSKEQAAKNEILIGLVRIQDGAEAQAFLDKQVDEGKMTSEEAAKKMAMWNRIRLKKK
jgi:hypothetical protein